MKNLIFVLAAMLLFSCSDDDKDYGLPPEVPGEVQSDDFRSIREDFALLCRNCYQENWQADDIQITKVDYYSLTEGYALLFTYQRAGELGQFCVTQGVKSTSFGTDAVTVFERLPFQTDFEFNMPTGDGRLSCVANGDTFRIEIIGEGSQLVHGTKRTLVS